MTWTLIFKLEYTDLEYLLITISLASHMTSKNYSSNDERIGWAGMDLLLCHSHFPGTIISAYTLSYL